MTYDGNKINGLEITITEDMIKDGLKGDDLIVYALIKSLTKESDAVFSPDAKEVAECLHISTAKAMESLNHLVSMGFIYKEVMKADREVLAIEYHMPEGKTRRKLSRTTVNDTNTLVSVTVEKPARQ